MRPWAYKAATSAMVTAIAYGGIAATTLTQPHPPPPSRPPAAVHPAASRHAPVTEPSLPGASLGPVLALRINPGTAATANATPGLQETGAGASPSPPPSSPAPTPAHTPAPAPSPSRTHPACLTVVVLDVCAEISIGGTP